MNLAKWLGMITGQFIQCGNHRSILLFVNQSCRRVAMPTVGMGQ